jgi:hypothetical protein
MLLVDVGEHMKVETGMARKAATTLWVAVGVAQFILICWGLYGLGVHWALVGFGAALTAFVPILGSVLAAYGIVDGFGASWPLALAIIFGPQLVILLGAAILTWINAARAAPSRSRRP